MLQLTNVQAKLASFNPRAEKHGDENVPAGDLKFELRTHSSVLDAFDKSFRPFLFRKPDLEGEQQPLLEGDTLTALAKPNLKPLTIDEKFTGYTLRISRGLEASDGLHLVDVEVSNFKIEPISGGSVSLTFSATVHPDADEAGELCSLIQEIVDITLEPPQADKQRKAA